MYGASRAPVVKNLPASAGHTGDAGLIPGLEISPGGGHGNPLQCSCPENPMDRRAWWAMVHRVTQSWTQLKQLTCTVCIGLLMKGYNSLCIG